MLPPKNNQSGDDPFPKKCPFCKVSYDEDAWEKLRYRGIQRGDVASKDLEMRSCGGCGSTLVVPVPADDIIRHEPPTPRMFTAIRATVNKDSGF